MESKPRSDVGVPQAEMPEIRLGEEKVRRTSRGLIVAVVVLSVAVVGLGALLFASTREDEGGVIAGSSEWLIDEYTAALNRSDGLAAAAVFTEGGTVRLADGTVHEGKSEIEAHVDALPPMNYAQIGDLTGDEERVTGTFSYSSDQGSGTVTRVFVFAGRDVVSVTDSGGVGSAGAAPQGADASGVPAEYTAVIGSVIAALNGGDAQGAARYYAEDAVLTYWGGDLVGRDAINAYFENTVVRNGWQSERLSPLIGYGQVAAAVFWVQDESEPIVTWLTVYTFDSEGRIRNEIQMEEMPA